MSRNLVEKAVLQENNIGGKVSYLTSSINFENHQAKILSHNNSNNNLHQSKKLNNEKDIKDKVNMNPDKITGKIFHYQDQAIKSQNISQTKIKTNFPKKVINTSKPKTNVHKVKIN